MAHLSREKAGIDHLDATESLLRKNTEQLEAAVQQLFIQLRGDGCHIPAKATFISLQHNFSRKKTRHLRQHLLCRVASNYSFLPKMQCQELQRCVTWDGLFSKMGSTWLPSKLYQHHCGLKTPGGPTGEAVNAYRVRTSSSCSQLLFMRETSAGTRPTFTAVLSP